ncbi:MAG: hypothetical protein ACRCVA_04480, partial [Phreatobacter sp.]
MAMTETTGHAMRPTSRAMRRLRALGKFLRGQPVIMAGVVVLACFVGLAVAAALFLPDPARLNPIVRLRPPSLDHL